MSTVLIMSIVIAVITVAVIVAVILIIKSNMKKTQLNKELKENQKYINALSSEMEFLRTEVIEKNDFISKMSHDIRIPLTSLKGLSAIGIKSLEEKEYDKVLASLKKIEDLSDSVVSLINDVVEFYKNDDFYEEEAPCTTSFNIKEWFDAFKAEFIPKAENIDVIMSDENLSATDLIGDKDKIDKIFVNIISNAFKYSEQGSVIKFDLSSQKGENDNEWIIFDLSVTAQNMPSKEYLLKVFNPYEFDDFDIPSSEFAATMVKLWINSLNGDTWVCEKEDGSYCCSIKIPFACANSCVAQSGGKDENTVDFTGKHALVVEDNDINREIACEILKSFGFIVEDVPNGYKAIEKFTLSEKNYYDVIMMDIIMPEKNGWEASLEIRNLDREDAKDVIIIAMSGNVFDEDIRRARESGMNSHIKKPIDVNQLFKELNKLLSV